MSISAASGIQRWRAVAELIDAQPALITLASNVVQLREIVTEAYFDVINEEVRASVKKIHFEKFEGNSTKGHWKHYSSFPVPK